MDEDPNLNATQACAAKCVRCHWVAVSFGALPGGGAMRCGHCGEFTALKVRLEDLPVTPKEAKALEEMARAGGIAVPKKLGRA
jgi:hypothetical protein